MICSKGLFQQFWVRLETREELKATLAVNISLGCHDALVKYADDSKIIAPVCKQEDYRNQLVSQILDRTKQMGYLVIQPNGKVTLISINLLKGYVALMQ